MGFHPPAVIGRAVGALRREAPPSPRPDALPRPPANLEVFGVGVDHCQITWSALGPGTMRVDAAGRRTSVEADGGPGAVLVDGLPDGATTLVEVRGPGIDGVETLTVTTLERPGGALLARVATVSDCHLGAPSTGFFHTLQEVPEPDVEVTSRCLQAAVVELDDWGADLLVVKGDLVDVSTTALWEEAAEILSTTSIPNVVVPGNHELSRRRQVDPFHGAAAVGVDLVEHVHTVDLAEGRVRVVGANVACDASDVGRLDHVAGDIVEAVAGAQRSLVAIHHHAMRTDVRADVPPGIPRRQATALCRALGAADANTLVTSGHTHRNRRRVIDGITTSQVGSTRDFPGVWAGYEFYDGGVVQTVRRIAEPSCIRWSDFTRRSALGAWSRVARGTLDDRCFTLRWR